MDAVSAVLRPRKRRRRRRRLDRPAISAHLLPDNGSKGEVGILSEDLFRDLFPGAQDSTEPGTSVDDAHTDTYHVAVAPWMPAALSRPDTVSWTILPVQPPWKLDSTIERPHSSLTFPASSLALQPFFSSLPPAALRKDSPIEIRVYDVLPLGLDTVFVKIDGEALRKLDEVHAKFGGGVPGAGIASRKGKRLAAGSRNGDGKKPKDLEETWKKAVREALSIPKIVHSGSMLPLPLLAHPITHVPPPPAKIVACEPVSQGLLLPRTNIVVLQSSKGSTHGRTPPERAPIAFVNGHTEDDDDTSNEQFYSAAEDGVTSQGASPPNEEEGSVTSDQLDSEQSGAETDNLSDDSEDMISLNAPLLPPQPSGALSSFTAATPRAHTNGITTPGSMLSSFTATTVRGQGAKGKTFKAVGLTERISEELLHPKPTSDEDEEARIYVDTTALVKVGCFSGDWVRVEAAVEPTPFGLGSWGLGGLGGDGEETVEWRAVKVYGLPESMSKRPPRYPVNKSHDRRSSVTGIIQPSSTPVYLSPVLLANMGGPTHVKVSFFSQSQSSTAPRSSTSRSKALSSTMPPVATEVAISKLHTPLSMEKRLQDSLFSGLKKHFASRNRVIKSGDLIGIPIDEMLGRAVSSETASEEDPGSAELFSRPRRLDSEPSATATDWHAKSVAWFKVSSVQSPRPTDAEQGAEDTWAGMAAVDPGSTTMRMMSSEQGKLPPAIGTSWPYYLGARRLQSASAQTHGIAEPPKPFVSPLRRRLRELISAAMSAQAIHLGLPPLAVLLSSSQRLIGKSTVATKACEDLGVHAFTIDAFDVLAGDDLAARGDVKTTVLKTRAEKGLACGPEFTALLIKHIDALEVEKMVVTFKEILADSRVLIATTTNIDHVHEGVRSLFTHELDMNAPDEGEREGILQEVVHDLGVRLAPDVALSSVAVRTAALVAGDLVDVIERATVSRRSRLESLADTASQDSQVNGGLASVRDVEIAGGSNVLSLTPSDLTAAVDAARKNFADAIGAPKIPNVSWSDVGGLAHVKDAVMETIQLPLARPELFAKGMKKRSGILFYGPPGTGKTLLAKAIATEFSLNFFSVKGPELLNMYIGESEANVRRVFQRARDARPCVVFFDELDSVAPKRGNQGDSGGVMDRIVSQLLAELDGMSDGKEGAGGVFVIGATNRPDLLDQALLRPGRFDKMLYLGVSDTHEKQQRILEALTRKFALDASVSLARVASTLPFTYTGADLYALGSDAMLKAITRQSAAVDRKVGAYNKQHADAPITTAYFFDHFATDEDTAVSVTEDDFHAAKRELIPSVSAQELEHYDRVRKAFEGDGKKKDEPEQRASHAVTSRPKVPTSAGSYNAGKGKGKGRPAMSNSNRWNSMDRKSSAAQDSDDDDFVIRTDHLKSNGSVSVPSGKGKGKGISNQHFRDAVEDDEDMYQ